MQHLEISCAVRPIQWPLGVKWLNRVEIYLWRAEDFFRPLKIRRLRPGLNPRTWVLKASTLPLDHRSRYYGYNVYGNKKDKKTRQTGKTDPVTSKQNTIQTPCYNENTHDSIKISDTGSYVTRFRRSISFVVVHSIKKSFGSPFCCLHQNTEPASAKA